MNCFVIMPFGNPRVDAEEAQRLDHIYSAWIKPTVEAVPLVGQPDTRINCHRGDKALRPGEIVAHVVESLLNADIVIADLTGRNANVFYELGVRHALRNGTILIAQDTDDLPFDLRGLRAIPYKYDPQHLIAFRDTLAGVVSEVANQAPRIDNPVRIFLQNRETERRVDRVAAEGLDVLKDMAAQVVSLREDVARQFAEFRNVVEQITSQPSLAPAPSGVDHASFEGVWLGVVEGGYYYPRFVHGELRVPYCYGANDHLTGHLFNCRLVGNKLFARFRWFDSPISGFACLKLESSDFLSGGWWYSEDIPLELRQDARDIDETVPGMNHFLLSKVQQLEPTPEPDWVERYYDNLPLE